MTKPIDAIELIIASDLTLCSIDAARMQMSDDLLAGHRYIIRVNWRDLWEAARIILAMKLLGYERHKFSIRLSTDYDRDEWSLRNKETGKIVWSPGV